MNLAQAVASNDLGLVRELCRNGHDPNETFACGSRQSSYAVQPIMGHAQNFEPDDILYGATPLNLAVLNGNEDIVRVLIDAGADLNKKDGRGRTPLLCAIYGLDTLTITPANLALISQTSPAHLSILRNCILPHPSITLSTLNAPQDEIKGITPLCLASYLGKEVVVRCLLEAGKVDVDATDRKGATALMYAGKYTDHAKSSRDRHMAVVKCLLDHDASPDLTDSNGWSSIQYGQMYPEIVQMFEAALRCKRPEVMHLLTPPDSPRPRSTVSALDRSADGSSNAALPYALSQSLVRFPLYYSKLSSLLSSHPVAQTNGASTGSINGAKPASEGTPSQQIRRATHAEMLEAIKLGDYMLLQSLLMAPPSMNDNTNTNGGNSGNGGNGNLALVNYHDPQTGLTPLHHALRTRPLPSMETVKILYQAGADMNAQSHYGRTALHHLCRFSLEHALTPINDDGNTTSSQATGSSVSDTNGAQPTNGATSNGSVIDESKSARRRNRYRTETNGSTGSNHLTPHGKDLPGSSAASTTSSNDLSTGPRTAHGTLADNGVIKAASPEDIQRASKHLADCCRLLLRLGSLVNIQDRHGNTPLHFAVEYGCVLEVVSVLVQQGADIELRNTKGLKPLDVVRGEQSEEMRRILESGRSKPAGEVSEDGAITSKALAPSNQPRDSILKPLNLPETLYEVDFQFNQVLQNLEHYQNHTAGSIETSLLYITDQIQRYGDNEQAHPHGLSPEEYNENLASSIGNLKYELESTYELLMITEEQYKDVVTFYESELDEMTRQNLTVLTAYDSEKSKVTGLYSIYTRLLEQLEELEAENEGLKMELEEKKRRGLVSLGRLVHGAMGGEWSGTRNGTSVTLAKRKAAMAKQSESMASTSLDEEQLSQDASTNLGGLPSPSMVLASQGTLVNPTSLKSIPEDMPGQVEKEHSIPRPTSPSQTVLSSEGEPALHTISVLSQKVSLLEQELLSKACDIKERDLLVSELTELIEAQSKAVQGEIKSLEERADSLMSILCRVEAGEQVHKLVDELAVKIMVQEDERTKRQRIQSGIAPPGTEGASTRTSGDWAFLLRDSGSKSLAEQDEQDIMTTLKTELEQSKAQIARLELANSTLQDRWQQAMKELEDIRLSEAANSDQHNGSLDGTEVGSVSTSETVVATKMTRVFVSTRPRHPQDEPLALTLDENGGTQEDMPTLEEIELLFEILMTNLGEISRDAEEAELRLQECVRAKEQIYQKCLYLDGVQKKLDENVEKIVSQPFKADTQPNFMQEQIKLQNQLNQLMDQAESVTNLHNRLKQDLQEYKEEKQARLRELDNVRELMRKIGPQELLRGLLAKLEGSNPEDPAAQRRREVIAAAVAQGMEIAAEMATEEGSGGPGERVQSNLWRNSCSVIDEGDVQDAIDSRLSTASIDHYTQSCSISDHKLFIQSLCSTLYALQMTTTHQIVSLKTSLAESRASLILADQELSNLNDQIASLYDDVGTVRNRLRGLQGELERLIQHCKIEVEKVWEIVGDVASCSRGDVKADGNGVDRGTDDEYEGSVCSVDMNRKDSIKSRALATSSRYSTALSASLNVLENGGDIATTAIAPVDGSGSIIEGTNAGGNHDSVARSISISRAERASVLRRISSPVTASENDVESLCDPFRASREFSETSESDRLAVTIAEMDRLRQNHVHLLSTLTEYKKQITVVKDRNLRLVATLLDRERVRLWTADGQDEVISAIVGQNGHNNLASQGEGLSSSNVIAVSGSSSTLAPGVAAGAKKHHHLSLTAAEDGIKLLRCQLERIRQCEMTRFSEMGVGLTMNYTGSYPQISSAVGSGSLVPGMVNGRNGEVGVGVNGVNGATANGDSGAQAFSKFEATLYSDLESRFGSNGL
ncbi:hypothetical protein BGZ79_006885 [Entomortierella chlamydospora]|nr:hypothetical protein BGZ79_006885 [Entomortierella chlamydospora]